MNIFFLDQDPYKAAEYLCDKHVVKMVNFTNFRKKTQKRVDKRRGSCIIHT